MNKKNIMIILHVTIINHSKHQKINSNHPQKDYAQYSSFHNF